MTYPSEGSPLSSPSPVLWWRVASATQDRLYTVRRLSAGDWRCDCHAFGYGHGTACKHIRAAQGWFICGFEGSFERPCRILAPPEKVPKKILLIGAGSLGRRGLGTRADAGLLKTPTGP